MGARAVDAEESLKANQRRQYRVAPTSAELAVAVVLQYPDNRLPGQIVDLSAGGIGVLFEQESSPIWEVGQTVLLELTSEHLGEPVVAPALVHHREEVGSKRQYGFEFVDPIGLQMRIPPELAAFFNQRRVDRVEPDPEHPIPVRIEGVTVPFEVKGFLRDFSTEGLSFRAPPLVEVALSKTKRIKISFGLPDSTTGLSFLSRIRHRDLIGGSICYGVCFDRESTPDFKEQQEKLEEYARACRQEALDSLAEQRDEATVEDHA
jgi:hypothetical protein